MRLAKSLRIVLGIAASGGVAVLLSGSAFAADSGKSMTSENVGGNVSQNVQDSGSGGAGDGSGSKTVVNDNKKIVEVGGSVGGAIASQKDPSNLTGKTVSVTPDAAVKQTAGNAEAGTLPTVSAKTAGDLQDSEGTDKQKIAVTETKPVDSTGVAADSKVTRVVEMVPNVVFHSAILPVQAKITNFRPAAVVDLAAMVPSAPAQQQNPAKVPTPSQPSGVLGRISAELAGSVVPRTFWVPLSGSLRFVAQIMIAVLLPLLAFSSLVYGFGAVLRRGGYVHAARSDVSPASVSLFATPFRLGYVPALQPSHNPFLVADTKTVLSMSATLQERRK